MTNWFLSVAFLLPAVLISLRCIHMLQLSSYQNPGYLKWLKDNGAGLYRTMFPVAVACLLCLWESELSKWFVIALFVFVAVLQPHKKAKKPLKFTARAVRLAAADFLLLAAIACLSALIADFWPQNALISAYRLQVLVLCGGLVAVAYIALFANILTMPLQKAINKRYIDDAKRILAGHPGLLVIGVTGSYGKTSTKAFLSAFLSVKYNVLVTPESYNTPMGVVRTIREGLNATHQVFVCEMGARHVGDIQELCEIVGPRYGMITSIGPQHLETFHTIEAVADTKFELVDALPPDGIAFLADGNELIHDHPVARRCVRYALQDGPARDVWVSDIKADRNGSSFLLHTKDGGEQRFVTPLLGRHQVENTVGAIAVALTLGIPLEKLVAPARALKGPPHRLQLIDGGALTIIDDAYNANPAGTKAALDTLAMFDGVKILVTPGMVELGQEQEALNRAFGVQAAAVCDYVALVGVKQTQPIADGLAQAGFSEERGKAFETLEAAMSWVRQLVTGPKIVLLENDLPDNYT